MTQIEENKDHRPIDPRLAIDLTRRYIYSYFRYSRYRAKAIPLEANSSEFDANFFIALKKIYFAERSYFRRFFKLQKIKRIQYI